MKFTVGKQYDNYTMTSDGSKPLASYVKLESSELPLGFHFALVTFGSRTAALLTRNSICCDAILVPTPRPASMLAENPGLLETGVGCDRCGTLIAPLSHSSGHLVAPLAYQDSKSGEREIKDLSSPYTRAEVLEIIRTHLTASGFAEPTEEQASKILEAAFEVLLANPAVFGNFNSNEPMTV